MVFTILVPAIVGGWLPLQIAAAPPAQGWWRAGWAIVALGGAIYLSCLLRFLQAGGTPMIFFARPLRFLVGEEPYVLVTRGLYERTRNPMYLGVLTVIVGQAVAFASPRVALYALLMFVVFNGVVIGLEEPHLRAARGPAYDDYCRRVPRWL
jgi:protein-S-isoprenylcysteine O-methyltransferase Ste14